MKNTKKALPKLERPPLLYQSVQDAIKAHIFDNGIRPGDPLPPETELARQLGVSRNSVREAVKALESTGILESRRGSGVFVREFSFEPLLDNLPYGLMVDVHDVAELLEIRRILELAKIGDAIERLTDEQLATFDALLAEMQKKAETGKSFPSEDRRFHQLLFQNLGNRMLLKLIDVFWLALSHAARSLYGVDPKPLITYRNHAAIVEALAAGDASAAQAALDVHYDDIRDRLAQIERGRSAKER